jgi:hypothetical protein
VIDQRSLVRMELWSCLAAGVLVIGAALLFDTPVALGVLVGSLLSIGNFHAIRTLLGGSIKASGGRKAMLQMLLMGKMGLLILLVFLAIRFLPLSPIALAVGISVFLVGIIIESVRSLNDGDHRGKQNGRA